MSDRIPTPPIEPSGSRRVQKQEEALARQDLAQQIESDCDMRAFADEAAFEPSAMYRRFESLEERWKRRITTTKQESTDQSEQINEVEDPAPVIEAVHELAENFERDNPELLAKVLEQLLPQMVKLRDPQEVLKKVLATYPDHFLADEALSFLSQVTQGETKSRVRKAREELNQTYGREVRAGRNISEQARAFSQQGLGSPTGLRDVYRDITGNPREVTTLFEELYEKFGYKDLGQAIDFFLHSLGADLRSKGPSISHGELHRLSSESRNLQAILWVFRFFEGRMNLIHASFERSGMLLPHHLNFELLAKVFIGFLKERYPSMDRVLQLATKLGIGTNILAQVILFTQMRDGVRGVAPRLFRHEQHKYDVLMSFIEALEELEAEIEEIEEDEERGGGFDSSEDEET